MNPRNWMIGIFAAWALGGVEARAHFLFAKVGPMAQARIANAPSCSPTTSARCAVSESSR